MQPDWCINYAEMVCWYMSVGHCCPTIQGHVVERQNYKLPCSLLVQVHVNVILIRSMFKVNDFDNMVTFCGFIIIFVFY